MNSHWERIDENVFLFRDSCLVYAVRGPAGTVLVNAGTGACADHLGEVARGKVTLVLTHAFRDHTDGAIRLHEAGVEVLGPYWEQEYFLDPEQHFRERQLWNIYDNRWDRLTPIRPLPVTGWLMDCEKRRIAGLEWEVIPTPGVTAGASSYAVTVDGKRLAFVGEVISGPGKLSRIAPLQYNYNDLTGAANIYRSLRRIEQAKPGLILPSVGGPVHDPAAALDALRRNLSEIDRIHPGAAPGWEPDEDDVEEVLPHLYRSKYSSAETHFVVSDSGKVLALDYGYATAEYVPPARYHQSNRRPFLHGVRGLEKRGISARIDAVLASHYHDDHVNGIPMLHRLFGTKVWAAANFSDILERPGRYDRPCLWHEPVTVDRAIGDGETVRWENIPITVRYWTGHTRFGALICLEVDGARVVHTGDQLFFWGKGEGPFGPGTRMSTNHVYRNGLDLGCYGHTLELLEAFRPELVLTGHTKPYRTNDKWYEEIRKTGEAFDELHRKLMFLGDDDVHFGAESQPAKLKPYQMHLPNGGPAEFAGWVLNPFPTPQTARLVLVGPAGWKSDPVEVKLGAREKKDIRIRIVPPSGTQCRRQPVALDLTVGGRPFGQVVEALVTAGLPRF